MRAKSRVRAGVCRWFDRALAADKSLILQQQSAIDYHLGFKVTGEGILHQHKGAAFLLGTQGGKALGRGKWYALGA